MKIYFYCTEKSGNDLSNFSTRSSSGSEYAMILAASELAAKGHTIKIFNRAPSSAHPNLEFINTETEDQFIRNVKAIGEPDILIFNGWASAILKTKNFKFGKHVYWCHNFVDMPPFIEMIDQGKLDYVLCVSINQMGSYRRHNHFNRFTYLYNAIDRANLDTYLNVEKENSLLFVGAPRKSKGFDKTLEVFDSISKRRPGLTLNVAGAASLHGVDGELVHGVFEPDFYETIRKNIETPDGKIRSDVRLHGSLGKKELYALVAKSKLLIQNPSWEAEPEAHSISSIEAQYLSTPVLSTSRGGQPESVNHGLSGFLLSKYDLDAFSKAAEQLLANPKYAKQAHRHANNFSSDSLGSNWETVLNKMNQGGSFSHSKDIILNKIRTKLKTLRFKC